MIFTLNLWLSFWIWLCGRTWVSTVQQHPIKFDHFRHSQIELYFTRRWRIHSPASFGRHNTRCTEWPPNVQRMNKYSRKPNNIIIKAYEERSQYTTVFAEKKEELKWNKGSRHGNIGKPRSNTSEFEGGDLDVGEMTGVLSPWESIFLRLSANFHILMTKNRRETETAGTFQLCFF